METDCMTHGIAIRKRKTGGLLEFKPMDERKCRSALFYYSCQADTKTYSFTECDLSAEEIKGAAR
jgi:hypothetical protein